MNEKTPKLQKRLRIISGQVLGLERMLGIPDTDCKDVLTQLKAVMSAMRGVGNDIAEEALTTCANGDQKETDILIKQILKLYSSL